MPTSADAAPIIVEDNIRTITVTKTDEQVQVKTILEPSHPSRRYSVSTDGRVWCESTKRVRAPKVERSIEIVPKNGRSPYTCVRMCYSGTGWVLKVKEIKGGPNNKHASQVVISRHQDGRPQRLLVCRLVAAAWVPNPDNLPEIDHKSEVRSNNHSTNLQWCTHKFNMNKMMDTAKKNGLYDGWAKKRREALVLFHSRKVGKRKDKGTRFAINDGVKSRLVPLGTEIPTGWVKGWGPIAPKNSRPLSGHERNVAWCAANPYQPPEIGEMIPPDEES